MANLRSVVLADSPSAYFRLGESRGTTAADEIGGTGGVYTAAFTLAHASLPPEQTDLAVALNGSTGYVNVADRNEFDLVDTFTLECWASFNAFRDSAAGDPCVLIDKGANAYVLRQSNAVDGTLLLRRNGVANICTSSIRLVTGRVYHIVATKNGSTAKLYVNGVDVTVAGTNSTMTDNSNALGIGVADITIGPANGFLNGTIDEVAVYKTALSAARVQAHYAEGCAFLLSNGGALAAGNGLSAIAAISSGGALAGGNAATARASIAQGGATAGGATPGARGTLTVGGAVAAGIALSSTSVAPLVSGGAAASGRPLAGALVGLISGGATAGGTPLFVDVPEVGFALVAAPVRLSLAEAIMQSHQIAVQATLLSDGVAIRDLPIVDGAVVLDANAAIRGRLDMTIPVGDGTDLIPTSASSPLAPYGNEVQVSRGVLHPDGFAELVSLGIFRLDEVDIDDEAGTLGLRITGSDRSARVIDARFEDPYQIAAGTNYADAILAVVQAGYPDVEYSFSATTATTPQINAQEGDDRWGLAQSMATAIGMELFFDGTGTLILRPVPTPLSGSPVWYIVEGENGVLLRAGRQWVRQGSYNRYIVTGESTSSDNPPARGIATDDNPLSPTYYYGRFGRVPGFYVSPLVTTDDQAADAAAAMLARQLGTTQTASFGSLVNPALAPGDIVRVSRERAGIVNEDNCIDSITIPLAAAGEMTGATRATQVV